MKITVQHYDSEFSLTEPDDIDIGEAVRVMRKILFSLGYAYANINDYIPDPHDTIKVTVKGGIAECDSPLIEIIDLDDNN